LSIQEGEVAELLIPSASWEDDLDDLLPERASKTASFSPDEVERDVVEAIAEVRREQRDRS
jgi:hypothetical protein